ncbi:putative ABC transport system permease protein [Clavibacter sp. B3I6]|uniref:ABC transporter permease n=1 Tax=Clavibacter sp. B3I6 TaxID=3042268 RepID=UPI00277DFF09|nr:ABC transporter permease [Clavibacter sp. B3I6]MDQ0745024.1 putative ABC transport system permease protein [Clavibacter sp. B3I6]
MFGTYLRRELTQRRKQSAIIAIGMALAIALVIVVDAVSGGVRAAQSQVLSSVYGVGTDVTVTQAAEPPTEGSGPGQDFQFGAEDGTTSDGSTDVSTARLVAGRGTSTFDADAVDTVAGLDGVSAAAGTLTLTNTSFSGRIPGQVGTGTGTDGAADGTAPGAGATPPTGGADGAGGSAFSVDSFGVTGVDPSADAVGPLTATTLVDGRALTADDAGSDVVVLDETYATGTDLAVGGTLAIAGTDFAIVGIVAPTGSDAETASNAYIPLDVAQALAGLDGQISTVSVTAASSTDIPAVKTAIEGVLPDATVSTQEDLASSVSGSLSTASSLIASLGTWLSLLVLAAAFAIAILLTVSGVSRRTREFGTLKAIGWSDRRIVRQVAGESLVQGLMGGALGVVVGLGAVLVVDVMAPTLSAGSAAATTGPGGMPGGAAGGGFGGPQVAAATTDVVLHAPVTASVILVAVGLSVLGGLLAGGVGGWRASRLRPAEALRSVA